MNTVLITFSIFSAVLLGSYADKVPYKDCGSKLGVLTEVDITPCPNLPCPFKKNTNVSTVIYFTANSPVTAAKTKVYGLIEGVLVPFPLPDSDACDYMKCPINKGDKVVYRNQIFVQPTYPSITLVVKWEIKSGDEDITCFTIPVTITS